MKANYECTPIFFQWHQIFDRPSIWHGKCYEWMSVLVGVFGTLAEVVMQNLPRAVR